MAMEDEDSWAPKWGDIRESPQYQCGMIFSVVEYWGDEDIKFLQTAKYDPPEPPSKVQEYYEQTMNYCKQVRETRGYDVVCHPPHFLMQCPFQRTPDDFKTNEGYLKEVKFAIDEINAQAQKFGKRYELKEFVKLVISRGHRSSLLTFTVTEVHTNVVKTVQAYVFSTHNSIELVEWRFKPAAAAADEVVVVSPKETTAESPEEQHRNKCPRIA